MRTPVLKLAGAALIAGLLAASTAQAGVTFYATKSAFDAASTTSLLEDFSTTPNKNVLLSSLCLIKCDPTPESSTASAPPPSVNSWPWSKPQHWSWATTPRPCTWLSASIALPSVSMAPRASTKMARMTVTIRRSPSK